MKGFCPLASGSKGNCLYFGTEHVRLLIDAGLSLKALEARLEQIDVNPSTIDAVLVTHEHIDHIRGLFSLCSRYSIPVFANSDTAKALLQQTPKPLRLKIFTTGETFEYGGISIHPFSIQHDAVDPVAFTLSFNEMKIGVCADLGFATSLVKSKLKGCDILYIEANHQPEMVHASSRPAVYKQRVLSRQGHLSNAECAELIKEIVHKDLRHIYLAHLSSECNAEDLAVAMIKKMLKESELDIPVSIAWQDRVSQQLLF
jgi:phosphoribosyl 1,2-cyclic phosphodiesterase